MVWSTSGTPIRDTPVTVLEVATGLPTTLYGDETKSSTVANPVKTDDRGNLAFFAVPGKYKLRWDGATSDLAIVVEVHPNDPAGGGGGVTDHGLLTGLLDDDHPQYHNDSRGDARYYTKTQVDASLAGKANTTHTHATTDITGFNSAVDARIQNVVGAAPAALDTLDELAQALGDDANFAATMTTALAGKQPIDADLTVIAGLSPADGSVLARVAGAWSSRTATQLKSDLGITYADISGTLPDHKHMLEIIAEAFGGTSISGHHMSFTGSGTPGPSDHVIAFVPVVPGKTITAVKVINGAAATFSASGTPAQCLAYDFNGNQLGASPNDTALWGTIGLRTCTFTAPFAAPSDGKCFFGFSFGGFTGVSFPSPGNIGNAVLKGLAGGKQLGIFKTNVAGLPSSFNPATYGDGATQWIPLIIVVSS